MTISRTCGIVMLSVKEIEGGIEMVEKEGNKIYLVKLFRENGDMEELFLQAPDDHFAIYNARKSFDREFELLNTDEEIPTLLEIKKGLEDGINGQDSLYI